MTNATRTTSTRTSKFLRQTLALIVLLLLIILLWEGVKWIGGDPWWPDKNPFGIEHKPPLRFKVVSDLNLPHVWDIAASFTNPAQRNGPPLFTILYQAAFFTFREALSGFLLGASLGLLLGILFAHFEILERGCMPYIVASQTVPILAIAPMVILWLNPLLIQWLGAWLEDVSWISVAVIAAYLTFFPVTINTLRGLRSPDPMAVELMRSYAASRWAILWKLRFPAALPYIFTAFKISATASIVGAIIGELPSGIRGGLGRAILNFNQYYVSSPSRLWATIIASAAVGILFYLLITLVESLVLRGRKAVADNL